MELRHRFSVRAYIALAAVLQIFTAAFGVLALTNPAPTTAAQSVPYLINFQGRLTDNNGNVLSDGSYNVKFRIFNDPSAGTNLWEGDRVRGASDNRITVQNGLFNIQFGDTSKGDPALSPTLFNNQTYANLYLEVEMPTPATATCSTNGCAVWTEGAMTPRQPLASSPYAFNSDTIDGIDGSSLVQLSVSQQTGSVSVSGNITSGGTLQGNTVDAATSGALTLGSSNATSIALAKNTTMASGLGLTLQGNNALTLGSTTAAGGIIFKDGTANDYGVTLSTPALAASYNLNLPSAAPSTSRCLKTDSVTAGNLTWANCAANLQDAYDGSSTPATITTTSGTKDVVIKSGATFNSATAFQVIPDGTTTPTFNVDTTNNRVGIGTAAPADTLDVAGGIKLGNSSNNNAGTIRFNGSAFQGYDGASWLSLGTAAATNVGANKTQTVYKTSDQTVNNSATFVNDTQLTFNINPNETWAFHMYAYGNSSTTADLKFSVTAPAGATCNWSASEAETSESNAGLACGASSGLMSGSGANDVYNIDGYVTAGATGGSVTLQWAQNTATAVNSIIRAGSFIQAMESGAGDLNPFVLGGNSFGATAQLGTADNNELSVITNGTEAINISTSQNVGIGAASGGAKLDVSGDFVLRGIGAPAVSSAGQGRIYFDSSSNSFKVSQNGGSYVDLLGGSGANAALSNLAAVDINTSLVTSTTNTIDVGSSANPFRSGYFGTSLRAPELSAANNTDLSLQATGTGALNFSSGSGIVNIAASTFRTSGTASLDFDIYSAITSTLNIRNTNGANVANVDVSGGLNIGASQTYKVGGSQISSANLSDSASITTQGNTFNGTSQLVQTDGSGALPSLSGANLTSLNASNIATGSGAVTLQSAAAADLTLTSGSGTVIVSASTLQRTAAAFSIDLANAGASTLSLLNSNGANVAHLSVSGGLTLGSGQSFAVGASTGAALTCSGGQILQDQVVVGGIVTGGTCATGGGTITLQDVYANSSSPAQITTTSATKDFVIKSGTGFNSTTALQVIPDGTTTATINVDTQNSRLGVGNNAPSYTLDVTGDVNSTGVYRSSGTSGVSRTCTSGEVLQGAVVTGGIVTGGVCATGGTGGGGTSQIGALVAQVYDSAGGTNVNAASPVAVPWNAQTRVDAGITHSTSTNNSRVTLDDAGWYRIAYNVSSQNSGASGINVQCRIRFNGTTYNNPSSSYSYSQNSTDSHATNTASVLYQASASDYFEIMCNQSGTAGTSSTIANQSWAQVEKIDGAAPFTSNSGAISQTTATDRLQLKIGEVGDAGLEIQGIAAQTANFLEVRGQPGATNPFFALDSDRKLQFGAGGASALDTALYRNGAGILKTDGEFQVGTLASGTSTPVCIDGSNSLASCTSSWGVTDLQGAYDGSSNPEITLGAGGGLSVRDAGTPVVGNLFEIQNNTGSVDYFAVSSSGISTSGNISAGGDLSIGSGQTYKINGIQISSADLSNDANITKQGNTFNGTSQLVQTDGSGALPSLSGANLTSLNASNIATGSGAVSIQSAAATDLTLTAGSGTINVGAGTLQRTAAAFTFDLANAGTSTFSIGNSNGANVANLDVSGSLSIGASGVFAVGGSLGSAVACSGGQLLQNQTVVGGIVTGGSCVAPGADTSLSNLTSTSINQSLVPSANNTLDIGSSANHWRTGYFGTSAQAPLFTDTGDVTLSSGTASTLTVDSGTTGSLNIGTSANAKNITIGNATGATSLNLKAGTANITIGASDTTGTLLVLDTKTDATDPTGANGGMYYNSSLGKFRCYENGTWKDCVPGLAVRSFLDTTADAVVDNNTTSYWDNSAENNNTRPNITPNATDKEIFGILTMETQSTGTADLEVTARIESSTSVVTACNAGTAVGAQAGTFASNTNARKATAVSFIDAPGSTSTQYFNVCADTDTVGTTGNITRLRMSLFEVDNSNADLAEVYPTNDRTIHDGEVVTMDTGLANGVKRSASPYDRSVVGVISTSPALLIGGKGDGGVTGAAVALSGRVPVLVTDENGPVKAGDPLTSSSTPGMAMKATRAGYVIGRAMQDQPTPGQSLVMGFVGTHYYNPGESVAADVPASLAELVQSDPAYLGAMKRLKTNSGGDLVATITSAARFAWSNTGGQVVAWVSDTGEAFFRGVRAGVANFDKLITGDLIFKKDAKLAGQAEIPHDQTEVFIESGKITATSIVTITPTSKTEGQSLYVKERKPGEGFVVGLEGVEPSPSPSPSGAPKRSPVPSPSPTPEPIKFNWLVVNQE